MNEIPTKVFISYSHDGREHEKRVLDLADRLREDGIDAEIDLYLQSPPEGWPAWCERQIENADFVLMVCTETYHRRVKGGEAPGRGLGVEARIIRQLVYASGAVSPKFIPVLFSDGSADDIPLPVKGGTRYVVDTEDGYEALYRRLTDQPWTTRPPVGSGRRLPARPLRHRLPAAGLGGEEKVLSGGGDETKPISLFYSYSHDDEKLRNDLADHLVPLERAGLIEVWHDRDMLAGDTVDEEIARKLQSVDVVLVLVSPSFIRSKYCYDIEMAKAIERHRRGEARVVPVIVRPCQWQLTPLKELLAIPTDARAVTEWPNRDTAFNDVAKAITKLATAMRRTGSKDADPAAVGAKPAPAGRGGGGLLTLPRKFADFVVFRDIDAPWCPEMVALPAGDFLMGSPESEEGRNNDEGPQHKVTIGFRFALGRYPVTVAEYDHFCDVTKREKLEDEGWGRGRSPAINVSWHDAQAYCDWLAKETGKPYRLPSEAEWEYGCRAGTTRPFSFGKTITEKDANFGWNVGKTTEVGSFPPNPWGLHDMHGNVWEWCVDHWHNNYDGAPTDGRAWLNEGTGTSTTRVLRGGSWNSGAQTVRRHNARYVRSASRDAGDPGDCHDGVGFRVVGAQA